MFLIIAKDNEGLTMNIFCINALTQVWQHLKGKKGALFWEFNQVKMKKNLVLDHTVPMHTVPFKYLFIHSLHTQIRLKYTC